MLPRNLMTAVIAMPVVYPPATGPVPIKDAAVDSEGIHLLPVPLHDGAPVRDRQKVGKFRPRAMYKDELASWYGISRQTFVQKYLPPIMGKLKKKGYTSQTRLLSLAMVNIIVQHHDWPGD